MKILKSREREREKKNCRNCTTEEHKNKKKLVEKKDQAKETNTMQSIIMLQHFK